MTRLESPDGSIAALVDPGGRLAVERDGRTVVEPSPFGLSTPYGYFPDGFDLADEQRKVVDETYELVHGKRSEVRHRAREATLAFEADRGGVDLQVRVANDGVAYRYRVRGEVAEFLTPGDDSGVRFPGDAVAWLSEYQENHEGHCRQLPVTALEGEYNLPGLFRVGDAWVLVSEAGVDRHWMAGRLVAVEDEDGPGVDLGYPEASPTSHVWAKDGVTSPWRVVIVGDLGDVVESTLQTDLVDGPEFDPDWVEPGRVAWSWWSSGAPERDFETLREYVDYAAERGWEYVLVDVGWDAEWAPDLVQHANDRGVEVELWANYIDLYNESKREERLSTWADWGVAGIKVDFMDSDDQGRLHYYDDLVADAAEHELVVNVHGSIVPTGLRRRWPHLLTYEGVRGAEYYKWTTNTPGHNAILPYTRNVVGPMDYTPVTFSADGRTTSVGHELALSVVYESGLQHYADSVETYRSYPLAEDVLADVPAAWDETRFLRGHPGDEATLARRRGEDWFVGSILAGAPRTIEVPLDFLERERVATVTVDDDGGESLAEYEDEATPDGTLTVSVAENGGFVARL